MKLSPRKLIDDLTGRTERRFARLIIDQIDTTVEAAQLVRDSVDGRSGASHNLRQRVGEMEKQGDQQRAEVVDRLSMALVTPLDREDLYRLSRAIDDILDDLRDFAREWDLYDMERQENFHPLLDQTLTSLMALRQAVRGMVQNPDGITVDALKAKKGGNGIRRGYQNAIADLLKGNDDIVTVHMLKTRELLRRLDIVGMRITQAADVLTDAAVKRSH